MLRKEDARTFVEKIRPSLGHDFTYEPVYPRGRNDVCVVRHSSSDGEGYGFDTIYMLWRDTGGEIRFIRLVRSEDTDYAHIAEISDENGEIIVSLNNGSHQFAWPSVFRQKKIDLDLA